MHRAIRWIAVAVTAAGVAGCGMFDSDTEGAAPPAVTAAAAELAEAPAVAEATDIAAFYGSWIGATVEGVDRDLTTIIQPTPDGGFTLFWRNVEGGDLTGPGDQPLVMRERDFVFAPDGEANHWRGTPRAREANVPISAWATLVDGTLRVVLVTRDARGRIEEQVYDRTRTADNLVLAYRRYLESELTRELTASLIQSG